MNDLRFDLRANVSGTSGHGIAYIDDSSNEGRPGFIMVDLGTGESWRRLNEDFSVLRGANDVPSYQGRPFYFKQKGSPVGWQLEVSQALWIDISVWLFAAASTITAVLC